MINNNVLINKNKSARASKAISNFFIYLVLIIFAIWILAPFSMVVTLKGNCAHTVATVKSASNESKDFLINFIF